MMGYQQGSKNPQSGNDMLVTLLFYKVKIIRKYSNISYLKKGADKQEHPSSNGT